MSEVAERAETLKTYGRNNITVISTNDPHCSSQSELEEALVEEKSVIIIKDPELGKQTVFYIRFGKCLDGMSVTAALASLICSLDIHHDLLEYGKILAVSSVLMHLGFQVIWNRSMLMQYRIAQGANIISIIRGQQHPTTILVRNHECKRHIFYGIACAAAMALAFWNDVSSYDFKAISDKFKNLYKKE